MVLVLWTWFGGLDLVVWKSWSGPVGCVLALLDSFSDTVYQSLTPLLDLCVSMQCPTGPLWALLGSDT